MLNLTHVPGRTRDDVCDHCLTRGSMGVNTSYKLGSKVKVIKINKYIYLCHGHLNAGKYEINSSMHVE